MLKQVGVGERGEWWPDVIEAIVRSYLSGGGVVPTNGVPLPNREGVADICLDLLRLVFPGYFVGDGTGHHQVADDPSELVLSIARSLEDEAYRALRCCSGPMEGEEESRLLARQATRHLIDGVPATRELLLEDIEAAYEGDPAAKSHREVVLAYPCLVAISIYRLAHLLQREGVPLVPRMMTEYAHSRTGIDIHPGARIGRRFFIDHGTGVVIGETAQIGDNVKLYQGVTLGARSFPKDESGRVVKGVKRHPCIEDDVTIYSGATILGGDVVIGRGSVIGGNVWLTHSVPPRTKVLVSVAQEIRLQRDIDDYRI